MLRKPKTITRDSKHPRSLKPQQARSLIRRFHTLQKWKRSVLRALAAHTPLISDENYRQVLGADYTAEMKRWQESGRKTLSQSPQVDGSTSRGHLICMLVAIDGEELKRGGLHVYQMASTVGQDTSRGGDSSKWLVKAAKELKVSGIKRTLEIGSLSVDNCLSRDGRFGQVSRIDLNSQHPAILQQDFMQRPLPLSDADRFDLVSCSLVLNFVADSGRRYDMLRRITQFLMPGGRLFLVLPRPCVDNSRYMDSELLSALMRSLGFQSLKYHVSAKLCYALYEWCEQPVTFEYRKKELRRGSSRNNFYIDSRGESA